MSGFDDWLAKKKAAPQSEKNSSLARAAENLGYEEVKALIAIGAKPEEATGSIPFLAWALRKTDDFEMVNLLLDLGVSAKGVGFKDMWALLEEDRARAYTLMERMAGAGMEISERAKAAADAAKKGDFEFIERRLLQPGEDLATLLDLAKPDDKDGLLKKVAGKNEAEQALYKAHFASGVSAEKLQESVNADGMTGFMLAIRAGKTADALGFYRSHNGLDTALVLQEDRFGQSAVTLLGHRNNLATLFAADLWPKQPEQALLVLEKVPARYAAQLDQPKIARELALARLARRAPDKGIAP